MLWYCLFFALFLAYELNCEIILPDGRSFIIPEPSSYTYILTQDFPLVLDRMYILEENYNTALLCPKGYSIVEITQEFVNSNSLKSEFDSPVQHHVSLHHPEQSERIQISPCPVIYDCLGYQACLFKYSSKFCQYDLTGSSKHVLLLFIVCHRDDAARVLSDFEKQRDLVLHIYYEPWEEGQKRNIPEGNVKHFEWPEVKIFNKSCPSFSSYYSESFRSVENCSEVVTPSNLTDNLLLLLGSSLSESCIQELKEIFCAFQYNKQGLCIPSVYYNKDAVKKRIFSYRALPEPAPRLSTKPYKHFLKERYASLIPARLAFLIMVYKDVSAAIELLNSIYEDKFLYAFHVGDVSAREDLQKRLSEMRLSVQNVFILSAAKSFKTTQSSYETVRAELEGFEELLRLGVWDFAINLNENFLPLRNVHDLAMALASHRGLSFLSYLCPVNAKETSSSESSNGATFHVCDGQVYKIDINSSSPDQNELQIFKSSHQGAFSREFIEYLVDESSRSSVINKYQFYLQTLQITEEIYIATVLMNSNFRHTLHIAPIHTSKRNIGCSRQSNFLAPNGSSNHQELGYFSHEDTNQLHSLCHSSFFAQKFPLPSTSSIRRSALDLAVEYYTFFEKILPRSILKALVEEAFSEKKLNNQRFAFERVLNVQIVPSLVPHDACCRSRTITNFKTIVDYNYWLDLSILDRVTEIYRKARVMLQPIPYQRYCYGSGNLKMVFISPWMLNNSLQYFLKRSNWNQTMPVPYGPAFSNGLYVLLLFIYEAENENCSGKYENNPIVFDKGTGIIKLSLKLISPDQKIRCVKTENILNDPVVQNHWPDEIWYETNKLHQLEVRCGEMEPGPWTLQITQIKPSKSRTYEYHFLLLDFQHEDSLSAQIPEVTKLWKLNYFAFLTEKDVFDFDKDEDAQRKHFHSKTSQKKIQDFSSTKVAASSTVDRVRTESKNESIRWFICSGGVTTIVTLSLDFFLMFCYWKHYIYKTLIFLMVLSLTFASLLQILIFILFCKH